jgi:hypothetical protein
VEYEMANGNPILEKEERWVYNVEKGLQEKVYHSY